MPTYVYEALNPQGKEVRGEMEASTNDEAVSLIRAKNLFPTRVTEKAAKKTKAAVLPAAPGKKKSFTLGRVKTKELTTFTRQLSTLLDAGLPLVRSLRILQDQTRPGPLKNQLIDITEDVEAGMNLSEALSKHPKTFDKLYVNIVKAGEAGGVLEPMLQRLAVFMEKSQKLKKQILSAMIYPAAVIAVAGSILAFIIYFVVPKFETMFKEMNIVMPAPTVALISFSRFVVDHWYFLLFIPLGLFILYRIFRLTTFGRFVFDFVKLYIPIFGMITRKATVSRFARTLGTLLGSGVPILEALRIVKDATGNEVFGRALTNVHNSIREGDSIAGPLRASRICDAMVISMVEVGEQTGELHNMLVKISDTFDDEVDALVTGMMGLLEPLLIVCLGGAVAFIVIALFLPLIQLIKTIGR